MCRRQKLIGSPRTRVSSPPAWRCAAAESPYGPAPHGSDYEYYADGRVKFASDLFTDALIYDGRFKLHDRAYVFDQVGRLDPNRGVRVIQVEIPPSHRENFAAARAGERGEHRRVDVVGILWPAALQDVDQAVELFAAQKSMPMLFAKAVPR